MMVEHSPKILASEEKSTATATINTNTTVSQFWKVIINWNILYMLSFLYFDFILFIVVLFVV